jgi:Predicted periplasmic lipoprotein (DUF2279)
MTRFFLSYLLLTGLTLFGFSSNGSAQDSTRLSVPVKDTLVSGQPYGTFPDEGYRRLKKLAADKKRKRVQLITGINIAGYGGSLILLNAAWYKQFPRSSFKSFNDSREWQQVDKIGHAWTAYNTGKYAAAMWEWAGLSHRKATWLGGLSGAGYLTVIEVLDGFSKNWGWSWSDIAANIAGSGLFIWQELAWKEQRIQFKFSFHNKSYGEPILNKRADELFGKAWYERMLKDYNGQTYWLSANLKSFFPESKIPAWLNISFGYGAEGMLGGFDNTWKNSAGNEIVRNDIRRYRQFYIAPDIDLTKIKTNKKWLKAVFNTFNLLKFPAPTLKFDSRGKLRFHAVYF